MKAQIASTYPEHQFIGEESHAAGEKHVLSDEPTFVHPRPGRQSRRCVPKADMFASCLLLQMDRESVALLGAAPLMAVR